MQFIQPILNFLHEWADAWVMLTAVGTIALAKAPFRVIQQGQQLRKDAQQQREDTEPVPWKEKRAKAGIARHYPARI